VNAPAPHLDTALLQCPRCAGVLRAAASRFSCANCAAIFPVIDDVPWLLPEAGLALVEWRSRTQALLAHLAEQAAAYRDALRRSSRASTLARLELLAAACDDHARRLRALLAPLGLDDPAPSPATLQALQGPESVAGGNVAAYFANVHRDWAWGEEENDAALADVRDAMAGHAPGRVLVVGVGAGRLAYDLHCAFGPAATVAADVNPLLLAVARRMYAGGTLELHEFPVAPRDRASQALLRRLAAPRPAPAGLALVAADLRQLPFAPGGFDTVLTPWLVDVAELDFDATVAIVNRLLRPGGRWICTGTLFFEQRAAEHSHSTEEVREVVGEGGFRIERWSERRQPYLASPASRHARLEDVVAFAACKEREAAPIRRDSMPAWASDPTRPIALLPAVTARTLALRVEGYIASLVDGRRSLDDIARQLAADRLLPADEAVGLARAFLLRLHGAAPNR
jgi:ubiquinone/menaquinone biosynthesis C-methylase UbiE/uncharacterized protein YbaR (Trm112 family)